VLASSQLAGTAFLFLRTMPMAKKSSKPASVIEPSEEDDKIVHVARIDEDHRIVFGWASVAFGKSGAQVVDSHRSMIDTEDLETAAYAFTLQFRELNECHGPGFCGALVESFMVTPDKLVMMGLERDALPTGWWVGFYVEDDEAWEKVKKGEYTMFSIEGMAIEEEVA